MITLDFASLQDAMSDLAAAIIPPGTDGIYGRTGQILRDAQASGRLGPISDLAALLRHILRRESLRAGTPVHLRIPVSGKWPNRDAWDRYGIRLHSEQAGFGVIEARPWEPDWVAESDAPLFEAAFAETIMREDWRRPIDPFLGEASEFSHYVSPGQREAVRSALLLPAGETLIVGLPTGSGKSFVGQAPVLARGLEAGLTLCVIPTTALVLDQARQMEKLLQKRFPGQKLPELAWHSGLPADRRDAIKAAIREGRQGVLYCSPEAVVGSLLPSLYEAARFNLLAYMVIDEAHLVSAWGDGFRPAFQMLAGVRRGLLAACPTTKFRTILMSATLAPDTIETIDALFGPSRTVQMVASVYLRPEPQYWVHREDNPERKQAKVLEALRHAPRPFILYVTKRDDARAWLRILKGEGFQRLAAFHGETPHSEREKVIKAWADNRLDGIVATSAFGVGIDKRDVRTILHAAVPETLDRFYQEVGRGGRDGRASASLLIYSEQDIEVAQNIAAPSLISDDLAYERWSAMFDSGKRLDDFGLQYELDTGTVPERLRQESDYNQAWNMRTLIMMARARVLSLESQSPARYAEIDAASGGSFDMDSEDDWADYFRRTVVTLNLPGHRDKQNFVAAVGSERARSFEAAGASQALLRELIAGQTEFSMLFDRLYRNHTPGRTILVSRACGGCPVDRTLGVIHQRYAEPTALGIDIDLPAEISGWMRCFPHLDLSQPILLLSPSELDARARFAVLESLVSAMGVRELCLPDAYRVSEARLTTLHRRTPEGYLLLQSLDEERRRPSAYQLSRVTMIDDSQLDRGAFELRRPVHVILATRQFADPFHPLRRLGDTGTNVLTLDQFQRGARA